MVRLKRTCWNRGKPPLKAAFSKWEGYFCQRNPLNIWPPQWRFLRLCKKSLFGWKSNYFAVGCLPGKHSVGSGGEGRETLCRFAADAAATCCVCWAAIFDAASLESVAFKGCRLCQGSVPPGNQHLAETWVRCDVFASTQIMPEDCLVTLNTRVLNDHLQFKRFGFHTFLRHTERNSWHLSYNLR